MKFNFKNPFVVGLLAAVSVVITDFLTAYIGGGDFSFKALIIAVGIATVGFVGRFLSGTTNTNVALLGSAILAIVPLISTGVVKWEMVAATFVLKLMGLLSSGAATTTGPPSTHSFYTKK